MSCVLCAASLQEYRLISKSGLAFCTINIEPLKDGHVMVLPIRHVTKLTELTAQESMALFSMIDEVKRLLNSKFTESVIIEMNTGVHGTQEHLHFHVLPSKVGLRDMIAATENVAMRQRLSEVELQKMRDSLIK